MQAFRLFCCMDSSIRENALTHLYLSLETSVVYTDIRHKRPSHLGADYTDKAQLLEKPLT